MLHVSYCVSKGYRSVCVGTVDNDLLLLAIYIYQKLKTCMDELWLTFGTKNNFSYIPAHEISKSLGPEKTDILPLFHAFTGCDAVSSFHGKGKKISLGDLENVSILHWYSAAVIKPSFICQ